MAEKWPKMAYLGPKWPFLKFQQSTLCGYSKIVSRDAWHHAKWINKFDHQFLGKMAQKWHNRTQKWPFSKYQQSTLFGYSKVVSGDAWHHTKWFNKIWSPIFSQNGRKMARKWAKNGLFGPKMAIFEVLTKYLLWVL